VKDVILNYFQKQGFMHPRNFYELFNEHILVLEKNEKQYFILVYNEQTSEKSFLDVLSMMAGNGTESYIISKTDSDLYIEVKPLIYKWITQTYGAVSQLSKHNINICFQSFEKLKDSVWNHWWNVIEV